MEVDNEAVNKNPGKNDEKSAKKAKIGEDNDEEKTEAMDIEGKSDDKSVTSMVTHMMIQDLLYIMAADIEEMVKDGFGTKTIDKYEFDEICMAIKKFEQETDIPMRAVRQEGWSSHEEKKKAEKWIVARKTAKKKQARRY